MVNYTVTLLSKIAKLHTGKPIYIPIEYKIPDGTWL